MAVNRQRGGEQRLQLRLGVHQPAALAEIPAERNGEREHIGYEHRYARLARTVRGVRCAGNQNGARHHHQRVLGKFYQRIGHELPVSPKGAAHHGIDRRDYQSRKYYQEHVQASSVGKQSAEQPAKGKYQRACGDREQHRADNARRHHRVLSRGVAQRILLCYKARNGYGDAARGGGQQYRKHRKRYLVDAQPFGAYPARKYYAVGKAERLFYRRNNVTCAVVL